jgi:protein-tyrosine phosphatase
MPGRAPGVFEAHCGAMSEPKLVAVGGGALALTHRPRLRDIPGLSAQGVTHVVTLLAEREGARTIGEAVQRAGLTWIWCPLDGGDPPGAARTTELAPVLAELAALIAGGAAVVIHCSAGIHRTGMIGYALLRQLGRGPEAARAELAELRTVTSEGVGEERLAWGDALAARAVDRGAAAT